MANSIRNTRIEPDASWVREPRPPKNPPPPKQASAKKTDEGPSGPSRGRTGTVRPKPATGKQTAGKTGRAKKTGKGPKKRRTFDGAALLLRLISLGLFLVILVLGFSIFLQEKYKPDIIPPDAAASHSRDAVLVLGCGLNPDGSPSPMLQERLDTGMEAYLKGAGKKLLLSGHSSPYYDEVKSMRDYVLAQGIPEDAIVLDPKGFSTWESVKRAKDVFQAQSLCLVSQDYHLYRALFLADSLGLDACGVAADTRVYPGQWVREAREILARVKDIYNAVFQPAASEPGEVMSLESPASDLP